MKLQLPDDEYLRIKVIPKSQKNEVIGLLEDPDGPTYKIRIKAAPEKGRANAELIAFLSKELQKPKGTISILSGKADTLKLIKISR